MHADIAAVVAAFDLPWSTSQTVQLEKLISWLKSEAHAAGGIGPGELDILENRHIADSLLYLPPDLDASTVLDVGSGVGLPGLVLAIAHPDIGVTVVDRSVGRTDLMKRAVRVTQLENVVVLNRDVRRDEIDAAAQAVTMRAAFPPAVAVDVAARLADRFAIIGLSRSREPGGLAPCREAADRHGFTTEVRKVEILDPPSWLLIMTRT